MKMRFFGAALWLVASIIFPNIASAKITVFACEPEWKALVEAIGGEQIEAYSATTGRQDPHHIEARPSLIAKARSADLLICTGADLEIGWLPVVQRRSGNSLIQDGSDSVFYAAEYVDRLEIPEVVDRSQGDVHAAGNPHVHLDPHRIQRIAIALRSWLQKLDPDNAEQYTANWSKFNKKWQGGIDNWESRLSNTRGTQVITHHRAWPYLFSWLGWESIGELEPLPGIPPTARHLAELVTDVGENKPAMIIISSYQDPRGAKWLSQRINTPVVVLPSTVGGVKNTEDLFSFYEAIVDRLTNALSATNQ